MAGRDSFAPNIPTGSDKARTITDPVTPATTGQDSDAEQLGSDENSEHVCSLCQESGQHHPAIGYCANCSDFLCQLCFNCHKTNRASRNHILVDNTAMPRSVPSQMDACSVHGNVIEYYCKSCDQFGCSCVVTVHNGCDVKYIPSIVSSTNQNDFEDKLNKIKFKLMMYQKKYQNHCAFADDLHQRAKRELQKERRVVANFYDKIERKVDKDIDKVKSDDKEVLKDIAAQHNRIESELQRIISLFENQRERGHICQTFVYMNLLESTLLELEGKINELNGRVNIRKHEVFRKYEDFLSNKIRKMFMEQTPLVTLERKFSVWQRKALFSGKVVMVTKTDVRRCNIKGMCVVKGHLIACDLENYCVKLVKLATQKKRVISTLSLSSWPWDVTMVTEEQVAVTVPDLGVICFLSFKEGQNDRDFKLSKTGEIYVGFQCRGISCSNERLVVSFTSDPGVVKILTLSGTVLQRFSTGKDGQELFYSPRHVAIGLHGNIIYVSDPERHTVTSLDRNGTVKDIYRSSELRDPAGLTVDRTDSLYICAHRQYNVHQLYSDLTPIQILLNHSNAEEKPQSIAYCGTTNTICIGMESSDSVNIFQLY